MSSLAHAELAGNQLLCRIPPESLIGTNHHLNTELLLYQSLILARSFTSVLEMYVL